MAATIRSDSGSAPIVFDRISRDLVLIPLEDGPQQVYRVADMLAALDQAR